MVSGRVSIAGAFPHVARAGRSVLGDPVAAWVWLVGLVLATALAPIWGAIFVLMGWEAARRRLKEEGLAGIGEVLAPRRAREQFAGGVWSGIWRTQKLSLAVLLVQLPTLILAASPAALAFGLLFPAQQLFPGTPGLVMRAVIPGLVALACLVLIAAQTLLLVRLLADSGNDYTLGLVFRTSGVAWRATLAEGPVLLGLALAFVAAAIACGAVVGGSAYLASVLELGRGIELILLWTGALVGSVLAAVVLDALAGWADAAAAGPIEAGEHFSGSRWIVAWARGVVVWLKAQGLVSLGIGACLAVGLLTAVAALVSGQNFSSWVGLGWFAVTAAVLVVLHVRGRRS